MQNQSSNMSDGAYWKIKQMIFQKKVVPGQRMVCKDMGDLLQMSRTPIINAFVRLEQEGFLVSEQHRGFYVKRIDPQEAFDLFGVREALESYAIEETINRCNARDIKTLKEKAQEHAQYTPIYYDRKKLILDANFHIQIALLARNQALEKILRMNFEHLYLRLYPENWDVGRMSSAIQEHNDILEQIENKDVQRSIELIRHHVRMARDNVINILSKEEESIFL